MAKRLGGLLLVVLVACSVCAGAAVAGTPVVWTVASRAAPGVFSLGDSARCDAEGVCDEYRVTATNTGGQSTDGSTVTLTDTVPDGLAAQGVGFFWSGTGEENLGSFCETEGGVVRCNFPLALAPRETLTMVVDVAVQPGAATTVTDTSSVSGGGVAAASTNVQSGVVSSPPVFGMSALSSLSISGPEREPQTQAGAHPDEWAIRIDLNNEVRINPINGFEPIATSARGDVKDVAVDLPPGFLGSALAAPACTLAQLSSSKGCPPDTQIGHIRIVPEGAQTAVNGGIYNVLAEHGVAAEFGFRDSIGNSHVLYARVVPTPAGYVLRSISPDVPQLPLTEIQVDLYGDPAAHDGSSNPPVAFLTNPSDCSGAPLATAVHMDSWSGPGRINLDGTPDLSDPNWATDTLETPLVTGCDLLHFRGSLTAQPETTAADSPSGLEVGLQIPQDEEPGTLATPPLKTAVVALPAGLAVNPSAAGGLAACSPSQIALGTNDQPACPEASKIGAVELTTPLIGGVLQGSLYLASQGENPFHSLLALYLVVDDPTTGIVVKIPAQVTPDPVTGQLTATFDQLPQFPFSDVKLHVFGGPRASLSTPEACGTYSTNGTLTPWSAPDSGPPVNTADSFQIESGCVSGFNPSVTADTINNQAGAFSPFEATFSRTDQDQNLSEVSVRTPPGLLGLLKSVERCPEPQASQGACGPNSLIGHATVGVGTGPDPFYVQDGQVFLTGPYRGAPFGLSVVVPAVAGPFNLGTVVVRAAIDVDPLTAQITVTSDPLPRILQGIPLDVRAANITIDRPGFIFNPTSCEPLSVNGTLTSTQGAQAAVSSHFQAANCANLPFRPVFSVSTQAKTSKQKGASLTVKGAFPAGEANVHSVAVVLPRQLPARLTTIQQACPQATFAANPASCPAGSDIGSAIATTPILANPVTGPAYLVSHGGAAFPDVVIVFQGEGITLDLVGSISIKHDITSSSFATVPDAPISSFALTLPEGPHSGLAAVVPAKAKGSLCGQSLSMPFTIAGQNGAVLKETPKIAVTGCAKAKRKVRGRKARPRKKK